ncbi:hypothetical protein Pfo_018276 [Paulownia fortunei]|nr:hypothetical protein Pfo_018276 [Paulownia fortunei]
MPPFDPPRHSVETIRMALNLCVNVKMITVIEEVFENLRCTRKGLSSENANGRLETFGQNKLGEKEE